MAKFSLDANFQLFIQIPREIIDILPILGYFWAYVGHVTSQEGAKFLNFEMCTS